MGTPFSSTTMPAQSAESPARTCAAKSDARERKSAARQAPERMPLSWHTQLTVCSPSVRAISSKVMRLKALVITDLFPPIAHADFLRCGTGTLFFSGLGHSEIHAGGLLAAKIFVFLQAWP